MHKLYVIELPGGVGAPVRSHPSATGPDYAMPWLHTQQYTYTLVVCQTSCDNEIYNLLI